MGKVNQPTATWEVIEHAKHGKHGTRESAMGKVNQPTATWEVIELDFLLTCETWETWHPRVSHPAGGGVLKVETQTRRHFSPASMIVSASNWL